MVTALVAGWIAVPDIRKVIEDSDMNVAAWPRVIEELDNRMELLKETLRSDAMRNEVSSVFEHDVITEAVFPGLGDAPLLEEVGAF